MRRGDRVRRSGGEEGWLGGGTSQAPGSTSQGPWKWSSFSPACFGKNPSSLFHAEGWIQGPITHDARGF